MFTGYGDGLIVFWDLASLSGAGTPTSIPMVGHTNKINHLEIQEGYERIFSSSDDCTLRQWTVDHEKRIGVNDRIFRFDDPVLTSKLCLEKNMLFTSCWDKQIRALMIDTGEVDKSWIGAQ